MGTHPIFESDFDCLTDLNRSKCPPTTWAITKKFSCYDLKRAGKNWTTEPGHLKGMKSLKYDTLSESKGLKVSANAEGGVNFSAGKANVTLKRNARKTYKSIRATSRQGNFRKDQTRAAVKKAAAELRAQQKAAKANKE